MRGSPMIQVGLFGAVYVLIQYGSLLLFPEQTWLQSAIWATSSGVTSIGIAYVVRLPSAMERVCWIGLLIVSNACYIYVAKILPRDVSIYVSMCNVASIFIWVSALRPYLDKGQLSRECKNREGFFLLRLYAPYFVLMLVLVIVSLSYHSWAWMAFGVGLLMVVLLVRQGMLLLDNRRLLLELSEQLFTTEYLANHDSLTGLYSRRYFELLLDRELRQIGSVGTSVAVLFMDLDGFKKVNDTLGHQAGDSLIQKIGQRLFVMGNENVVICRMGGDEFSIMIRKHNGRKDAEQFAERIMVATRQPIIVQCVEVAVSASVGIALITNATCTVSEALDQADKAMYTAKVHKDSYYVYQPEDQLTTLD